MAEQKAPKSKPLHLTQVQFKDFLIFKDVSLHPDPRVNTIFGKNRHGKTSAIKGLEVLFRGSSDKSLIRNGADKAQLFASVSDILEIKRTLRREGTNTLTVKTLVELPGAQTKMQTINAAQDYLDGLISDYSFKPFEFMLLPEKKRSEYLRNMFRTTLKPEMVAFLPEKYKGAINFEKDGIEIIETLTNNKTGLIYRDRADANKVVEEREAIYTVEARKVEGFDAAKFVDRMDEISGKIKDVEGRIAAATEKARQANAKKGLVESTEKKIADAETWLRNNPDKSDVLATAVKEMNDIDLTIEDLEQQIKTLREGRAIFQQKFDELHPIQVMRENTVRDIPTHKELLANLPKLEDVPDLVELAKEKADWLEEEKENNAGAEKVKAVEGVAKLKTNLMAAEIIADDLTDFINKLRRETVEALTKEANIPIKGLRFEGEKAFVGDISVDNLSTSEAIDFSITVVEEMNKDFPIKSIFLDRAEGLDSDTLKEFAEKIPPEYQLFFTIVQHDGETFPPGSYHVENGEINKI